MRYPVGDAFATELMLALYDKLLEKRRPLPAALNLALNDALDADIPKPPLSPATPILVGVRAAELQLVPPPREARDVRPAHGGAEHRLPGRAGAVRGPAATDAPRQPGTGQEQHEARRALPRHARGGQDGLRAGAGLPARAWPLPGLRLAPRPRGRQRHQQRPVQPDAGHPDPAQCTRPGADDGAGRSARSIPAVHPAAAPRAAAAEDRCCWCWTTWRRC